MANIGFKGYRKQNGETESVKYPGYILRKNGEYKFPAIWFDKTGKKKTINRYFKEVNCSVCGNLHLSYKENIKRGYKNFVCSPECNKILKSNPDGYTKKKRSNAGDDHILIKIPEHLSADRCGYVAEHRVVMEKSLGRLLTKDEVIHHINCVKSDNEISNLVVCKDITEHFLSHGSLNKCVADLISLGVLYFDRETMTYETNT